VYKDQYFNDADIKEVAELWKTLGLKRIESIECENVKMSVAQVVELFYPEVRVLKNGDKETISEHDKKQKEKLLSGIKEVKAAPDSANDKEKEYRAELRAKLKAAGQNPRSNMGTPELEELVSKL